MTASFADAVAGHRSDVAHRLHARAGEDLLMAHVQVVLRPLASPLALGFFGVAGGSLTLSGLELGWISAEERLEAGLILVLFASVPQLIASILAFFARDQIAATAMGVMAITWAADGVVLAVIAPGRTNSALGTVLVVSAITIMFLAGEATNAKAVAGMVLATAGVRFALTAAAQFAAGDAVAAVSGGVGIGVTLAALYPAAALSVEDARHRTVLPTGRRADGATAMASDLVRQAQDVAREAGVRSEL
jgi:succinate-acetate transporter protein